MNRLAYHHYFIGVSLLLAYAVSYYEAFLPSIELA